jgi:signal peptidase I
MKNLFLFVIILAGIVSCKTKPLDDKANQEANTKVVKGDTIKIANEDVEYEVIIIDAGFSSWLYSRALPRNYHSLSYLENKNQWYVQEWNRRVLQPQRYDRNLYEMQINYDPSIRYGYEVNYLIYNYMIYFQNTYKQQLFGRVPPR